MIQAGIMYTNYVHWNERYEELSDEGHKILQEKPDCRVWEKDGICYVELKETPIYEPVKKVLEIYQTRHKEEIMIYVKDFYELETGHTLEKRTGFNGIYDFIKYVWHNEQDESDNQEYELAITFRHIGKDKWIILMCDSLDSLCDTMYPAVLRVTKATSLIEKLLPHIFQNNITETVEYKRLVKKDV